MTTLTLKKTTLKTAQRGSLVRFDMNGHSSFAFIVEKGVRAAKVIILGLNEELFVYGEIERDEDVFDLGNDWFFEPSSISSPFVDGATASVEPGLLTFNEDGEPLLSVNDTRRHGDVVYWNLKSQTVGSSPSIVPLATGNWKLWASATERNSPNGQPLFTKARNDRE
ncbi:hypothetical protein G6M14_18045 [Agrobacterium tumefaciens]|uniref:hypothetical protein n=1 Tax=Agrobacterium tumefaciens TaxID=358 RepID=UPI00157494EA|nr:hypothetical protein [Agrobacterium tumefaciens]